MTASNLPDFLTKKVTKKSTDKEEQKRIKQEAIKAELEKISFLDEYEPQTQEAATACFRALASENMKRNGDDKLATRGFEGYREGLIRLAQNIIRPEEMGVLDTAIKAYHTPKQ